MLRQSAESNLKVVRDTEDHQPIGVIVNTHLFQVPQAQIDSKVALVKLGNQYGQRVIYPANQTAEIFCRIAGSKTLTQRLVDDIKKLGYSVEVVQDLPKEL
jgi:hypothetical protein